MQKQRRALKDKLISDFLESLKSFQVIQKTVAQKDDESNSQGTEKISDNLDSLQDDLLSTKKEPLKNTVKNLKKFGQGFIKGVQKVKNSASSSSNQFNKEQPEIAPKLYEQEQNQFKFKSNRKKETADFEGLKIIQELNDCKGAIWCMKWSICGRLLAVAGKGKSYHNKDNLSIN